MYNLRSSYLEQILKTLIKKEKEHIQKFMVHLQLSIKKQEYRKKKSYKRWEFNKIQIIIINQSNIKKNQVNQVNQIINSIC